MYASEDLFTNAKMSVPIILYTTEQIFCAHFMVHFFRRWGTQGDTKKARIDGSTSEREMIEEDTGPTSHSEQEKELTDPQ
jgi:hypothetical protein